MFAKILRILSSSLQSFTEIKEEINSQSTARHAARERKEQHEQVKRKWRDEILAEYKKSEGNKSANDERQYGVQNSTRYATWAAFVAAILYGGIAAYQACLTRESLNASDKQLTETLKKMQLQVDATNNWAVAANAAVMTVNGIHVDANLKTLMMSTLNIGHLPASGTLTVYELTTRRGIDTKYTVGFPIGGQLEGHWSEIHFTNATYASPPFLITRIPSISVPDYSAGQIGVVASGHVSYTDGFATTPRRNIDFCYISFIDLHTQQQTNASCDASAMTELIKKEIKFPDNKVAVP